MTDDQSRPEARVEWDGYRKVTRLYRRPSRKEVLSRSAIAIGTCGGVWGASRLVFGQEFAGAEALWGGLVGVVIGNLFWAFGSWTPLEADPATSASRA